MERNKIPIPLSALMNFDSPGESSDDSDFRIEDHLLESSEENTSIEDSSADSDSSVNKSDDDCDQDVARDMVKVKHLKKIECKKMELTKILICCVCLGDKSDDANEIVECDNCGVTVHEDCYGISENDSVSSSDSGGSKLAWFCEACRAGKENLSCELCPNYGGVFKETDTGKWVHLVCALYVSGVAFKDVDKLSDVTLFEMSYSKWGDRICSLCPDQQFTQTGVCIRCDAGLCRAYFHVTCAQREGLLAEAQSEEVNHADPFYAHCKLHSDKDITKKRKRNWLTFELQMASYKKKYLVEEQRDFPKYTWMKRKLQKYQCKYSGSIINIAKPWIPTQKMARPLTSSASSLRALSRKAALMEINTEALAMKEAHRNVLADVHRKWNISPAFNVEYVGYYLDRNIRISSLKQNLEQHVEENSKLVKQHKEMQFLHNQTLEDYHATIDMNKKLSSKIKAYIEILSSIDSNKNLSKLYEAVVLPSENHSSMSLVGKSIQLPEVNVSIPCENDKGINDISENLVLKCAICNLATDQHLQVKCDTCQLYYHLSCLDPPLTRMPKKSRVMGWQCSECDKTSSDSEVEMVDIGTPRQLRYDKVNRRKITFSLKGDSKPTIDKENHHINIVTSESIPGVDPSIQKITNSAQIDKNQKRKICQKDSRNSANSEHQQLQFMSLKPLKVNIEALVSKETLDITSESSKMKTESEPCLKLTSTFNHHTPKPIPKKHEESEYELVCDTCRGSGTVANIVSCDECLKSYHFLCLDPPVKKSPKARGYSWHCAGCDPSESESD